MHSVPKFSCPEFDFDRPSDDRKKIEHRLIPINFGPLSEPCAQIRAAKRRKTAARGVSRRCSQVEMSEPQKEGKREVVLRDANEVVLFERPSALTACLRNP